MATKYYKTLFRSAVTNKNLPRISKDLDSIRAYQWEVVFSNIPDLTQGATPMQDLTLAAKQISANGFSVTDIEVHRVNDKVFYPGKPNPELLTITFDNVIKSQTMEHLWDWFKKSAYNPLTGALAPSSKKINNIEVRTLSHDLAIMGTSTYFGIYPQSYKLAEFNYQTNDFHTIEVAFRYDFMDAEQGSEPAPDSGDAGGTNDGI